VDTAAPLALRQLSKRQLRAERHRVVALLRDAPPDRSRLLAHATDQRRLAEQGLAEAPPRSRRPATGWPNSARAPGGYCTAGS
jgi:hypothetical protein